MIKVKTYFEFSDRLTVERRNIDASNTWGINVVQFWKKHKNKYQNVF